MTETRVTLMCGVFVVLTAGIMLAEQQWLAVVLLLGVAAAILRPIWRLREIHVEVAMSAVEAAEHDPQAKGARRAAWQNGGLKAPDSKPERHDG